MKPATITIILLALCLLLPLVSAEIMTQRNMTLKVVSTLNNNIGGGGGGSSVRCTNIVYAVNNATYECKVFNECLLPTNYKIVDKCPGSPKLNYDDVCDASYLSCPDKKCPEPVCPIRSEIITNGTGTEVVGTYKIFDTNTSDNVIGASPSCKTNWLPIIILAIITLVSIIWALKMDWNEAQAVKETNYYKEIIRRAYGEEFDKKLQEKLKTGR